MGTGGRCRWWQCEPPAPRGVPICWLGGTDPHHRRRTKDQRARRCSHNSSSVRAPALLNDGSAGCRKGRLRKRTRTLPGHHSREQPNSDSQQHVRRIGGVGLGVTTAASSSSKSPGPQWRGGQRRRPAGAALFETGHYGPLCRIFANTCKGPLCRISANACKGPLCRIFANTCKGPLCSISQRLKGATMPNFCQCLQGATMPDFCQRLQGATMPDFCQHLQGATMLNFPTPKRGHYAEFLPMLARGPYARFDSCMFFEFVDQKQWFSCMFCDLLIKNIGFPTCF